MSETITKSTVQAVEPDTIVDGELVKGAVIDKPVLTITRTQEVIETITLEQVEANIAAITKELADKQAAVDATQARLDYQLGLKAQLEA